MYFCFAMYQPSCVQREARSCLSGRKFCHLPKLQGYPLVKAAGTQKPRSGGNVINVSSKAEFDKHCHPASGRPVIVDFSAAWCGPCKMIAPVFEKFSAKYAGKITFLKVDIDSNQDIAREHSIASVPTFILFAKGQKREQMLGADVNALGFLLEKYKDMQGSFQGTGRKLSDDDATTAKPRPDGGKSAAYVVDENKPTTNLQIRLANGNRLVAKFNTTTTVSELKSHIRSANPGGPSAFSLMAGVPAPKPLTCDDSTTLETAGLLESVVFQRA